MTQLSIPRLRGLSIGLITTLGGITIMSCTNKFCCGFSLTFSGVLLTVSAYKSNRAMSLCDLIKKITIYGAMGLFVWKLGNLGSIWTEYFIVLANSSPVTAPNININLSTEVESLSLAGASLAPVIVYQSIPGSKFGVVFGNFVVNTLRLSKHSAVYSKVVFTGLMLYKLR